MRLKLPEVGDPIHTVFVLPEINSLEGLMNFDRDYFKQYPNREHYARPFSKFDMPDIGEEFKWTIVTNISSGIRVRSYSNDIIPMN